MQHSVEQLDSVAAYSGICEPSAALLHHDLSDSLSATENSNLNAGRLRDDIYSRPVVAADVNMCNVCGQCVCVCCLIIFYAHACTQIIHSRIDIRNAVTVGNASSVTFAIITINTHTASVKRSWYMPIDWLHLPPLLLLLLLLLPHLSHHHHHRLMLSESNDHILHRVSQQKQQI